MSLQKKHWGVTPTKSFFWYDNNKHLKRQVFVARYPLIVFYVHLTGDLLLILSSELMMQWDHISQDIGTLLYTYNTDSGCNLIQTGVKEYRMERCNDGWRRQTLDEAFSLRDCQQSFNVARKRKFIAKGGSFVLFVSFLGGGGLWKMITSFLFLATLNFVDCPKQ